jgi:predicted metal-dependent hydrolase
MVRREDRFEYTVRVSARAQRVRLNVSPANGLVVVIPRGFDERDVPSVIAQHAEWIERAVARNAERRAHLKAHETGPLPGRVELPGIGVFWDVVLRPSAGQGVRGRVMGDVLVLSGETGDHDACYSALRRAVARAARQRLPMMLGGVEAETGWQASAVTIRRQRTRWGSCTTRRAISLNESLVFLPPTLVRYVLVHELAHTRRMDHSAVFWALVEQHDAAWRNQRRALRDAWRYVPGWADPSAGSD